MTAFILYIYGITRRNTVCSFVDGIPEVDVVHAF